MKRGCVAEEKCTGNAMHAYYELRGLKFEAKDRYQGKFDKNGRTLSLFLSYFFFHVD
jgi:hypothetical protein